MTRISIIIPIYKAEKHIERCVCCLMEQTMKKDIEFIFVNDCTPDNSMQILNRILLKYPHRKEQVVIIHNEKNLGPSDSRKRAINIAKGMYIGFCDSDDWIEKDMYDSMYDATKNGTIDIVVSDYWCERKLKKYIHKFYPSNTPQDALAKMNNNHYFSYAMWNQIIKQNIIKEQIQYIIPTKLREDTYLMMRVYFFSSTINFISKPFYHYWIDNTSSLCHNVDRSMKAWIEQVQNMNNITKLLYTSNYMKYHHGINIFKFKLKQEYIKTFPNLKAFYYTFRDSHRDYIKDANKTCNSFIKYLKMKIIWDSCYIIFWIYHRYKKIK